MSHSKGGFTHVNKEQTVKLRQTVKVVLADICKKLIRGSVNLTKMTIPVHVNYPRSYTQGQLDQTYYFPFYMGQAIRTSDKLERFKLYIAASIACLYVNNIQKTVLFYWQIIIYSWIRFWEKPSMACIKTELFYTVNKYLITRQSGIRTLSAQMNSINTGVLQIISVISVSAVLKFRIREEKISSSKMGNI